jgi:hypothetical protein
MTSDAKASNCQDLRLMALDAEDLAVLSAHLQDAVLHVRDMLYQPQERRFVVALHRFDWLASASGAPQRCQTGLHFEQVTGAALHGFRQDRPDDILNLLSVTFAPGEAPSGEVVLTFSGGCAVKVSVECLEARMADLGPRWVARHAPGHQTGAKDEAAGA